MKRTSLIIVLLGTVCAIPAAAQWQGMPIWNNPKGGTGVTIDGDAGFPNTDASKGNAYGARGELGLTNLAFTAGFSSWKPEGASSSTTTWADRKSTRLNSSHTVISYAVFCLKKKKK